MTADLPTIKPIIRELVRTQVCFPDIELLVDRISIIRLPNSKEAAGQEAYLLYLTDREKTIQAIVKRRLHRTINHGEVTEGSHVILKDYRLARGKRLRHKGEVIYLKVADFYSIGEEERQGEEITIAEVSENQKAVGETQQRYSLGDLLLEQDAVEEAVTKAHGECKIQSFGEPQFDPEDTPTEEPVKDASNKDRAEASTSRHTKVSPKRRRESALSELDSNPRKRGRRASNLSSGPKEDVYPGSQEQFPQHGELSPFLESTTSTDPDPKHINLCEDKALLDTDSFSTVTRHSHDQSEYPPSPSRTMTKTTQSITRPLKISPLASITGRNRSKNEIHDVLALITHVDSHTYKPPRMPRKRDLRIMDTSTSKRVVLSVFTDPVGFEPKIGTVALLRNLTTHDWDGGNLKAYPWLCEGRRWFVPDSATGGIEGVTQGELDKLRELRDTMKLEG